MLPRPKAKEEVVVLTDPDSGPKTRIFVFWKDDIHTNSCSKIFRAFVSAFPR